MDKGNGYPTHTVRSWNLRKIEWRLNKSPVQIGVRRLMVWAISVALFTAFGLNTELVQQNPELVLSVFGLVHLVTLARALLAFTWIERESYPNLFSRQQIGYTVLQKVLVLQKGVRADFGISLTVGFLWIGLNSLIYGEGSIRWMRWIVLGLVALVILFVVYGWISDRLRWKLRFKYINPAVDEAVQWLKKKHEDATQANTELQNRFHAEVGLALAVAIRQLRAMTKPDKRLGEIRRNLELALVQLVPDETARNALIGQAVQFIEASSEPTPMPSQDLAQQ